MTVRQFIHMLRNMAMMSGKMTAVSVVIVDPMTGLERVPVVSFEKDRVVIR